MNILYGVRDYPQLVRNMRKDPSLILEEMHPYKMDMLHAAVGISGEAGELLDCIKKCVMYGQKLDMSNAIEELGDIEFYMEQLRQVLEIDRDATLINNMAKLQYRYRMGYSDADAMARRDKDPE